MLNWHKTAALTSSDIASTPGIRGGVQPYALDPQRARALWQKSEQLVGESFGAN